MSYLHKSFGFLFIMGTFASFLFNFLGIKDEFISVRSVKVVRAHCKKVKLQVKVQKYEIGFSIVLFPVYCSIINV